MIMMKGEHTFSINVPRYILECINDIGTEYMVKVCFAKKGILIWTLK